MTAQLDPYQDLGPADEDFYWMSDAQKLRLLADWFDLQDELRGVDDAEIQDDLRRMAHEMEHPPSHNDTAFWLLVGVTFFLFVLILTV